MNNYIFNKNYFGRNYTFYQMDTENPINAESLREKGVDSFIILNNLENGFYNQHTYLRGLNISGVYEDLTELSELKKLEYLNINVKCKKEIPFEKLNALWCIYLNYDRKTCHSIFKCENLEYIFIDNYKEKNSEAFSNFHKAKRIGLMKCNISELCLDKMPNLEHLGIGYNLKLEDIEWLSTKNNLKSLAFANCKNIKNWEAISTLKNLEYLTLENCKEIPSLAFLSILKNLKEVRIIGNTTIMDGKIKDLLNLPNLQEFFLPIRKEYDLTFKEYTHWKNKMLPLEQ